MFIFHSHKIIIIFSYEEQFVQNENPFESEIL